MFPQQPRKWTIEITPPLISHLRAAASPEGRSLLGRAFPREGEGGRGSDRGRMRAEYIDFTRNRAATYSLPSSAACGRQLLPKGEAFWGEPSPARGKVAEAPTEGG